MTDQEQPIYTKGIVKRKQYTKCNLSSGHIYQDSTPAKGGEHLLFIEYEYKCPVCGHWFSQGLTPHVDCSFRIPITETPPLTASDQDTK